MLSGPNIYWQGMGTSANEIIEWFMYIPPR